MAMTPICDLIERMIASGMSADKAVIAARTAEEFLANYTNASMQDAKIVNRRRAVDRERKQVTRTKCPRTSQNQLSFLLPLNNSQSSPSEESTNREDTRARGMVLPADWQPSPQDVAYGLRLGLSNQQVDDAAEDMRVWAGANRNRAIARKADWGLTFKGWLRRVAAKNQPRTPRNGSGGSTFDVLNDLDRMVMEGGVPDVPITGGAGALGCGPVPYRTTRSKR